MKKKVSIFAALLPMVFLASCATSKASSSSSVASYEVKWVSPTGTPALAFYRDGYNSNWVSSSSPAEVVVPELKKSDYDAVVFDGISGLNVIKKSNGTSKYKLAEWITGGSFYLVSSKHTSEEAFVTTGSVESFAQGGIASTVFEKIAKEKWGFTGTINYEAGVAGVKSTLLKNSDAYDYYVIAEPSLYEVQSQMDNLNIICSLQDEWKEAGYGNIPGGALFINKDRYDVYKDKIDAFWTRMKVAKDNLISNPADAIRYLNSYENNDNHAKKLAARFGISDVSSIESLQKDGANKLNFVASSEVSNKKAVANDFAAALGLDSYSDELFL